MKRIGVVLIVVSAVVVLGCGKDRRNASSQDATAGTSGRSTEVSNRDKDFVRDVGVVNLAEIDLGRLATERSTDDAVKKFAQLEIDDHTKAVATLRAAASQYSIGMPAQVDDTRRRDLDKLQERQGLEFDRDYIHHDVDTHEDLVDKLESRIDKANLAEYKAELQDRVTGRKVEERAQAIAVLPEHSDNAVTMSLNTWAAQVYPVVAAHYEAAKGLKEALKKHTTH